MIKLSRRLQAIADMIDQGESIADIGTDHGFLPIMLRETGKSPHVILSDIKEGPLQKARENIKKYSIEKEFDLRIGSGLSTLKQGEVDVIVIAGMGGLLISEILDADLKKSKSCKKLILQPRNGQEKLRAWLFEHGFMIENEVLIKEGKYICEIILAVPCGSGIKVDPMNIDLEISPILFLKKDPLLLEFIENKIRIEKKIVGELRASANKDKAGKLEKCEERIQLLEEMRKRSG